MPNKRIVYDKATQTTLEMWEIDAREACANDARFSLTKPSGWGAKPPPHKPAAKPAKEPAPDKPPHDEAVPTS